MNGIRKDNNWKTENIYRLYVYAGKCGKELKESSLYILMIFFLIMKNEYILPQEHIMNIKNFSRWNLKYK